MTCTVLILALLLIITVHIRLKFCRSQSSAILYVNFDTLMNVRVVIITIAAPARTNNTRGAFSDVDGRDVLCIKLSSVRTRTITIFT